MTSSTAGRIILKPKEDRRIRGGHLWVFSNEIAEVENADYDGGIVDIFDSRRKFLGRGYYNRNTLIAARLLSRHQDNIDSSFFDKKIREAVAFRRRLLPGLESCRMVYSESDGLPGLIVDKYGPYLGVQILTHGMERFKNEILQTLTELFNPDGIILRNDTPYREMESLNTQPEIASGEIPDRVRIEENGISFWVDLKSGQKTGFFFDQRKTRAAVRGLARERKVLDCFSYTGGFSLNCALGGAPDVTAVDQSEAALAILRENAETNGLMTLISTAASDAFEFLRNGTERYDLIILDPPAFIKSRAKIKEGMAGYREINLRAMKLLNPDGILVSCSCSHHLSREDFLRMLRTASRDSGRGFRILGNSSQDIDHPVLLSMPETEYLKCVILQRI